MKIDKKFSASGRPSDPPPGLCPTRGSAVPLDPAWGSVPRPLFRLTLRALAMVRPPPPLANPGSAATGLPQRSVTASDLHAGW